MARSFGGFTPMGMDKNGNQTVPINTTAEVQNWTPRSGFVGTNIVSHGLVSDGAATVTVQWKVTLTAAWAQAGGALSFRVLKNGQPIDTAVLIDWQQSTATFAPFTTSLLATDRLTLQIVNPSSLYSPTIAGGAANTYLYYTVA
ncbi:hypothetical protein [Nocardia niigatensis]